MQIYNQMMVFIIVEGKLNGADEGETFTVNLPQNHQGLMERLIDDAVQNNPEVFVFSKPQKLADWVTFFTGIIPFIIIIILFFFLLSQSQGGGNKVMNFGK